MTHTPNSITVDFPQHLELIHNLKLRDDHFGRLLENYDEMNRAIHRAEIELEPVDDAVLEEMKKKRLALKDMIAGYLAR